MFWEWVDTAVPFALAVVGLLVLIRQIQRRRGGVVATPTAWLRRPSDKASFEIVPFKRRFKAMAWTMIATFFVAGSAVELQNHDSSWAGTTLFFLMLAGIPTACTIAATNAWFAELAQRRLTEWNALVAGAVGFVSCLLWQLFGGWVAGSVVALLMIVPRDLPWVLAPPAFTGVVAALVELMVRTRRTVATPS